VINELLFGTKPGIKFIRDQIEVEFYTCATKSCEFLVEGETAANAALDEIGVD